MIYTIYFKCSFYKLQYLAIKTECHLIGYWKSYQQSGNFCGFCRDNRVSPQGRLTSPETGKETTVGIVCVAHMILPSFGW